MCAYYFYLPSLHLYLCLHSLLFYSTNRPYHTIFPLVDMTKQTTEFIIAYPLLPAMIVNSTDLAADALIAQKAIWKYGPILPILSFLPLNIDLRPIQ